MHRCCFLADGDFRFFPLWTIGEISCFEVFYDVSGAGSFISVHLLIMRNTHLIHVAAQVRYDCLICHIHFLLIQFFFCSWKSILPS